MRRFVTLLLVLFPIWAAPLAQCQESWPQFGGPNANFHQTRAASLHSKPPTKRWQRQLGPGMSGFVAKNGIGYTVFLIPFGEEEAGKAESERQHREVVLAVDSGNGKTVWRHEYESGWNEAQQAFGGRSRAPQATPLICEDYLITIGFTGIVHCFHRTSGEVVWKQKLVDRYSAVPVQFGFSSSPVYDEGKLYILSGGTDGGLVCLNLANGKPIWRRPCKEASYATPVIWERPEGRQVVFVTRNRVVGASAETGDLLWDYQLPEKGLTNVPTPMIMDDQSLIVSGQGVKGTRRLRITKQASGFSVREVWKNGSQFFYCNWVRLGDKLVGCDGKLLLAIDVSSGNTIGRYRGYADSNLLLAGNTILVLHGDGYLSKLKVDPSKLRVLAKYSVFEERCWTPPTLIGSRLFCRGGDQLLCLDLGGGDPRAAVVAVRIGRAELAFKTRNASQEEGSDLSATERIVSAFEEEGAEVAWSVYQKIRNDDPEALSFEQRLSLAEMAKEAGLNEIAETIRSDADEDFPAIAKEIRAALNPSKEIHIGKNGLKYLQFSIRNTASQTIQAQVRGPKPHPFGYGLPLRPGRPRAEKWPVGTKLYRTKLGVRAGLLLEVKEDFAGRIIDLPLPTQNEGRAK